MSGNVTKKKTKQQLADEFGMNVKTMRSAARYATNIDNIENNIGQERAKKLEEAMTKLRGNKKEMVSSDQIRQLSMVSPEEQIRIVDLIIRCPQNAKMIINNAIPDCKTKITVTLPAFVSDWLDSEAYHKGLSKGKFIETLLCGLYIDEMKKSNIS